MICEHFHDACFSVVSVDEVEEFDLGVSFNEQDAVVYVQLDFKVECADSAKSCVFSEQDNVVGFVEGIDF